MATKLICMVLVAACLLQVLEARSVRLELPEVGEAGGLPVSGVVLLVSADRGAEARASSGALSSRALQEEEPVFADIPPVPVSVPGRHVQN